MFKGVYKIGLKFNKLTVVSFSHKKGKKYFYNFLCDCGNYKIIEFSYVSTLHIKSCGCGLVASQKRFIDDNFIDGESKTRLHRAWASIIDRCENKNNKSYKHYMGRGIKICDEWKNSFISFKEWSLDNGYNDKLSIDRIDNNGNYEPSNCRWTTMLVQQNNKRNNVFIEYNGETLTTSQWSMRVPNCNCRQLVRTRIFQLKWTIEKAITTPVSRR